MKVAELTGSLLDYWVAKAEGHRVRVVDDCVVFYAGGDDTGLKERRGPQYSPSAEWSDGGPLIERERISLHATNVGDWRAWTDPNGSISRGETLLVAAMRAYVASKFGEEVPAE